MCPFDDTTARDGHGQWGEALARTVINAEEDCRSTTTYEITNLRLEVDEVAGTAVGHAYWTVYQAASGTPRQPVLIGRYLDRFERCNGQWRFAERIATNQRTATNSGGQRHALLHFGDSHRSADR
ncbi:nuclear transport factor 2 family protein [Nocardia jiangxiensis]|uniref:Nuclear transport factor 2 family protein n=1 Tax=Nocardia jiangxiensis TaxID=282685 RepID=A0ABW6RX87_9NOCA